MRQGLRRSVAATRLVDPRAELWINTANASARPSRSMSSACETTLFTVKLEAAFQSQECDRFIGFGTVCCAASLNRYTSAFKMDADPHLLRVVRTKLANMDSRLCR